MARWTLGAALAPVAVLAAGLLLSHPGEVPTAIVPVAPVRAGRSLLPAIAFHTVINAVPDFAISAPARYEAAVAAFFVVALVLAVAVVAVDPVMLRRPHREEVQAPRPSERPAG